MTKCTLVIWVELGRVWPATILKIDQSRKWQSTVLLPTLKEEDQSEMSSRTLKAKAMIQTKNRHDQKGKIEENYIFCNEFMLAINLINENCFLRIRN